MNLYPNLDKLQREKKKIRVLPIVLSILLLLTLVTVIYTAAKVYRQADALIRMEAEPFPDVAENTMPIYTEINFKSLDGQTTLSGWYFANTAESFRGNVVLIHHNHADRVQYGLDTADLFSHFINSGFNVLAFDLRHSGRSEGEISSYGYSEFEDVIAAMDLMQAMSGKTDFILYGVGTGTVSGLLAWDYLPESQIEKAERSANMKEIEITREDVTGFILDTPVASANDYIRADLPAESFYDRHIASRFVPDAVKATAASSRNPNMIGIITKVQVPVLITRNLPDTVLESSAIDSFVDERLRLHPDTTTVFEIAETGHLDGFSIQTEYFLHNLNNFLNMWFLDSDQSSSDIELEDPAPDQEPLEESETGPDN
ncbi:MAG: hypothetical protein QM211_07685 [Bacillota bacterium]|nr:hypothetical protein [Bacillota bacterium]